MDQEGLGLEANIEDIKRVLNTYSANMSEDQINDFLMKN